MLKTHHVQQMVDRRGGPRSQAHEVRQSGPPRTSEPNGVHCAASQQKLPSAEKKGSSQTPLIFVSKKGEQLLVQRCNHLAARAGIRTGTSLPLAKALCPAVGVYPCALEEDVLSLYRLAVWGLKLTPLCGVDSALLLHVKEQTLLEASEFSWGLVLDLTGTERIHKNFLSLATELTQRLFAAGIYARIAVAPTLGAAWALSRFWHNQVCLVSKNELYEKTSGLPLRALRISEKVATHLEELGLTTIADIATLPAKTIGVRFGCGVLKRLDQLLGRVDEPFISTQEFERTTLRRSYETPLQSHVVTAEATLRLLTAVLGMLDVANKTAGSFLIRFHTRTVRGERSQIQKEISLHTASCNTLSLRSIVTSCVDTLSYPHGVCAIEVEAKDAAYRNSSQIDFTTSKDSEARKTAAEALLNTITAHLGTHAVMQAILRESYIPETSFSFVPVTTRATERASSREPLTFIASGRPTKMLNPPEPAQVIAMLPDKPPSRISWQGKTQRIITGIGPERISPEWWHQELSTTRSNERDYFRIQQEDGTWLWIFRTIPGQEWFVQGQW